MRWVLAISFFAAAAWMFIPDKEPEPHARPARFGAYGTTLDLVLPMEIGDKSSWLPWRLRRSTRR